MNRRSLLLAATYLTHISPGQAWAQRREAQEFASLGVGPFEIPLSGRFLVSVESGATVLTREDERLTYYLASIRMRAGSESEALEQVGKFEQLCRNNWETFAKGERGSIVAPFVRTDHEHFSVFSMATEFGRGRSKEYYVQLAIANGRRGATLFAEGPGEARPVLDTLRSAMQRAKVVE